MNIVNYTQSGFEEIKNKAAKLVVKVDAKFFSVFEIENKNISSKNAKKSIPFLLEPQLLEDIDKLEFFIQKNNFVFNIFVIQKQILLDLKSAIKDEKLDVVGAYPEFMFLPQNEGVVNYIDGGNDVVFRSNSFTGGSLNKEVFLQIFDNSNVKESVEMSKDYHLVNLLKYDFKDIWSKFIKPYSVVFILFLIIFAVNIGATSLQNSKNTIKLNAIKDNNKALFKSIFPDITQVVDIRVQTEQKMSNLSSQKQLIDGDFLQALLNEKFGDRQVKSLIFDKKLEVK
jgi:type II secretory pathway component PulL